jgi:hypothetical protein
MHAPVGSDILEGNERSHQEAVHMEVCRGMAGKMGKDGKKLEEASHIQEMLSSLMWGFNIMVLGAGSPKNSLAVLPSNSWIDGSTIDMMMSQLSICIHLDHNLRETTVVATLNLEMWINKGYKERNFNRTSVLSHYTKLFNMKKCTCLFFLVHINTNHCISKTRPVWTEDHRATEVTEGCHAVQLFTVHSLTNIAQDLFWKAVN